MMINQNDGFADGRGDSGTYAIDNDNDNDTCTGAGRDFYGQHSLTPRGPLAGYWLGP